MNPFTVLFSLFFALSFCKGKPLNLLIAGNDSELVNSNVEKVYAPAPFEDLLEAGTSKKGHKLGHHRGDSEELDGGFYTSKSAKGDNGHAHFDSYHKKGGDKYGYEAHSSFAKSSGDKDKYYNDDSSPDKYNYNEKTMNYKKTKEAKKIKDPKGSATDGDYYYSNYGSDEGDSEHVAEEGDHYDDDGGHYSEEYGDKESDENTNEGYEDEEASEGYYDGDDESEGYYEGEGETQQKSIIRHGGPAGGATSYSVRHY